MKRPNIVYVLTDQYRLHAMSFWRNKQYAGAIRGVSDPVYTPNIDRFADESMVFTQAVSNCPLCSPYRGMLLSGRFPENNGVLTNCRAGRADQLREDIVCLTDVLHDQGYDVGYIGKIHLDKPEPHFDRNGAYVGEGGEYFVDGSGKDEQGCWDMIIPSGKRRHGINYWHAYGAFNQHKNPHYWDKNFVRHDPKEWSPKHEADKAIAYILNKDGDRSEEKPFCLFVSMLLPHSPYASVEDTDEEIYHRYYSEEEVPDVRQLMNRPNAVTDSKAEKFIRYYFSHITGLDRQFGRILDVLDQSDMKDNTIVVFSSDHGDMMGSHGLTGKNVAFEESLLIPFVLRYPKKVEHRLENLMLGGPDVMPTLLGLAGMKPYIPHDIDGQDYSDIILGSGSTAISKPASALYLHNYAEQQKKGVRTDKYTFVLEYNEDKQFGKKYLFDNEHDYYQQNNLELDAIPPEDLEFLKKELGCWLKRANDGWYQQRLFEDFIPYPAD